MKSHFPSGSKGARLPRRDCPKCKGEGFIMGIVNGESRAVGKCDCWHWVSFEKSKRTAAGEDGKSKAAGGE